MRVRGGERAGPLPTKSLDRFRVEPRFFRCLSECRRLGMHVAVDDLKVRGKVFALERERPQSIAKFMAHLPGEIDRRLLARQPGRSFADAEKINPDCGQ